MSGVGRHLTRIVSAALAVIVVIAFTGVGLVTGVGGAAAQTPPGQPPSTVPANPDPTDPAEPPVDEPTIPEPVPTLPPIDSDDGPFPDGESLIPNAGVGAHPTFNYDIGYDEGAWNNFGRKFFGVMTAIGWLLNQVIVAVVLWFTGWAFGFDIIDPLKGPILTIAQAWSNNLIGPLGLNDLVWFILMTYVAFQVWRGRAMNAFGELVVSIIALGISLIISANPAGYLDGAERTLEQISGATLAVSRGEQPTGDPDQASNIVDPMRLQLHQVLIEEPYEIINWGRPLSGACADALAGILNDGPWAAKDSPRNTMRDAGCQDEYDFNRDPTANRMAGAWMVATVSVVVLIFILVAVVTMLIGSLFFILRFAWLPFALLGFQLPGAAREMSWGWLVGLFKNAGVVAGMSFVISYLLMLMSAFLTAADLGLAQRFSLILIVSVGMFLYRKNILKGIEHFFERVRAELGSWRPGLAGRGSGGFTGSAAAGGVAGMTGYGIGQRAREATLDMPGSRAYETAYMGRRFQYQTRGARRHGGRARSRSGRGYRQRMRAGSATDFSD